MTGQPLGVLLMTYGSPASLDDVERYIRAVRGGRPVDAALVAEMRRRYELIGGSPLVAITAQQAAALERHLAGGAVVRPAMRFSAPSIDDALAELADAGIKEAVGIILSPQYSPLLMDGYRRDIEHARARLAGHAPIVAMAGPWHLETAFISALAERVLAGLAELRAAGAGNAVVLMTAHSLPQRVARDEPDYLAQLNDTAVAIASAAGLAADDWSFCWQSAGHTAEEWLKPDFADLLPGLAAEGRRAVLVAPVQFVADHLEVLYDIDVAARAQADACGLRFARIRSLNADAGLVEALAHVALMTRMATRQPAVSSRASLSNSPR